MDDVLLREMFSGTPLSDDDLRAIGNRLTPISLKRGEVVLNKGQRVLYTYYVHFGCLRSFFLKDSGKDHTLQFAIKDWWISDYTAVFTGGPATMTIECIQDAVLYRLARTDMELLYRQIPAFETYFRKKLERRVKAFQERTFGNLALPAKERYLLFIATYPNIERLVKNYHIASYLGITTESLSRVRKEIAG